MAAVIRYKDLAMVENHRSRERGSPKSPKLGAVVIEFKLYAPRIARITKPGKGGERDGSAPLFQRGNRWFPKRAIKTLARTAFN